MQSRRGWGAQSCHRRQRRGRRRRRSRRQGRCTHCSRSQKRPVRRLEVDEPLRELCLKRRLRRHAAAAAPARLPHAPAYRGRNRRALYSCYERGLRDRWSQRRCRGGRRRRVENDGLFLRNRLRFVASQWLGLAVRRRISPRRHRTNAVVCGFVTVVIIVRAVPVLVDEVSGSHSCSIYSIGNGGGGSTGRRINADSAVRRGDCRLAGTVRLLFWCAGRQQRCGSGRGIKRCIDGRRLREQVHYRSGCVRSWTHCGHRIINQCHLVCHRSSKRGRGSRRITRLQPRRHLRRCREEQRILPALSLPFFQRSPTGPRSNR